MTTFKKGDRVRIKATVNKDKYRYLWDKKKDRMLGTEQVVCEMTEASDGFGWMVSIGEYLFFKEDLELIGLQPYDAVKVDAITGKIVYDAAVAAGKRPILGYEKQAVIFMDEGVIGLNGWSTQASADNSGHLLNYLSLGEFIERLLVKTEEPLKYKDWTVEIKPGSVTIGCTTVDNATVKKIIAGMGGEKKHGLKDQDCVTVIDNVLSEWLLAETMRRTGLGAYSSRTGLHKVLIFSNRIIVGSDGVGDRNELTIDQWLERCGGEVITTKQGNVQFNKDSISIGEYELPNELVKKIGEKLVD